MTTAVCSKPDCTISTTGKCLEAHTPPETCPFFTKEAAAVVTPIEIVAAEESPEISDVELESDGGRQFPAGLELGYSDVLRLSRSRYMHVVAVLGSTNAGKTCLLISLYLMALNRLLSPRFRFAGSQTLMGFEYRARGLRKWTGGSLPTNFADHTQLGDPRAPAFVHLALDECVTRTQRRELLFTDLPGEWTTGLIERAEAANRFQFLPRADVVIITLDGMRLETIVTRNQEIMQTENLLQRLAETINLPRTTSLIFVVTKCDELNANLAQLMQRLQARATEYGFQTTVIETAAISRDPAKMPNGYGMLRLLETILRTQSRPAGSVTENSTTTRSINTFGHSRRPS